MEATLERPLLPSSAAGPEEEERSWAAGWVEREKEGVLAAKEALARRAASAGSSDSGGEGSGGGGDSSSSSNGAGSQGLAGRAPAAPAPAPTPPSTKFRKLFNAVLGSAFEEVMEQPPE